MKRTRLLVISAMFALASCGGDDGSSGVPDSQLVGTLTADEARAVCEELKSDYPQRTVTCGDVVFQWGIPASETCDEAPPAACTATVGDYRECFAAIFAMSDDEICTSDEPPPAACERPFSPACN